MKKNMSQKGSKKTLKVNKENDIDSIIEIFQIFGKKYNIVTTTLDSNIQYQTRDIKITQTYTKTILENNLKKMITKLKNEEKIILIIIENIREDKKRRKANDKIKILNELENVRIIKIREKDTLNTLKKIIEEV